ncbi:polysaccharide biosynthesis tyrosine autokinase [Actinomycetaceae bacterium L2_0104]
MRDFLTVLRKNGTLILATILITLGGTAAWTLTRTPMYEASTQLFVSVRTGETSAVDLTQGSTFARQAVTSYVSVVNSTVVMDRVISDLGLPETSDELGERVTASSPKDTVLIDINVTDEDPATAAVIANKTSEVFADVISNQLERASDGSPTRVQIDTIRPAGEPEAPASPNVPRSLVLSLFLGLVLGVAIAFLRTLLDTRVRSKDDIAAITDLPILGTIAKDKDAEKRPLIALKDPRNPLVESYRALRTNLRYLNVEDDSKSIVITSAGPGEGKSTTAANLAIVMADAGARVVLIDSDLRKPRISKLLGIEGGIGLSDLLIGRTTLEDALQQWGRKQLFVLPSGRIPPNPSELLGSSAMARVLETLTAHFDYIIIDAPPVLVVTDAAILSTRTGGAVLVSAAGKCRKDELASALEALETVDGKVLGIIPTMVPTKGPDSYSYGAYAYQAYGDVSAPIEDAAEFDMGAIK